MIGWCFQTSRGLAEIALDQSLPQQKLNHLYYSGGLDQDFGYFLHKCGNLTKKK